MILNEPDYDYIDTLPSDSAPDPLVEPFEDDIIFLRSCDRLSNLPNIEEEESQDLDRADEPSPLAGDILLLGEEDTEGVFEARSEEITPLEYEPYLQLEVPVAPQEEGIYTLLEETDQTFNISQSLPLEASNNITEESYKNIQLIASEKEVAEEDKQAREGSNLFFGSETQVTPQENISDVVDTPVLLLNEDIAVIEPTAVSTLDRLADIEEKGNESTQPSEPALILSLVDQPEVDTHTEPVLIEAVQEIEVEGGSEVTDVSENTAEMPKTSATGKAEEQPGSLKLLPDEKMVQPLTEMQEQENPSVATAKPKEKEKKAVITKILELVGVSPKPKKEKEEASNSVFYDSEQLADQEVREISNSIFYDEGEAKETLSEELTLPAQTEPVPLRVSPIIFETSFVGVAAEPSDIEQPSSPRETIEDILKATDLRYLSEEEDTVESVVAEIKQLAESIAAADEIASRAVVESSGRVEEPLRETIESITGKLTLLTEGLISETIKEETGEIVVSTSLVPELLTNITTSKPVTQPELLIDPSISNVIQPELVSDFTTSESLQSELLTDLTASVADVLQSESPTDLTAEEEFELRKVVAETFEKIISVLENPSLAEVMEEEVMASALVTEEPSQGKDEEEALTSVVQATEVPVEESVQGTLIEKVTHEVGEPEIPDEISLLAEEALPVPVEVISLQQPLVEVPAAGTEKPTQVPSVSPEKKRSPSPHPLVFATEPLPDTLVTSPTPPTSPQKSVAKKDEHSLTVDDSIPETPPLPQQDDQEGYEKKTSITLEDTLSLENNEQLLKDTESLLSEIDNIIQEATTYVDSKLSVECYSDPKSVSGVETPNEQMLNLGKPPNVKLLETEIAALDVETDEAVQHFETMETDLAMETGTDIPPQEIESIKTESIVEIVNLEKEIAALDLDLDGSVEQIKASEKETLVETVDLEKEVAALGAGANISVRDMETLDTEATVETVDLGKEIAALGVGADAPVRDMETLSSGTTVETIDLEKEAASLGVVVDTPVRDMETFNTKTTVETVGLEKEVSRDLETDITVRDVELVGLDAVILKDLEVSENLVRNSDNLEEIIHGQGEVRDDIIGDTSNSQISQVLDSAILQEAVSKTDELLGAASQETENKSGETVPGEKTVATAEVDTSQQINVPGIDPREETSRLDEQKPIPDSLAVGSGQITGEESLPANRTEATSESVEEITDLEKASKSATQTTTADSTTDAEKKPLSIVEQEIPSIIAKAKQVASLGEDLISSRVIIRRSRSPSPSVNKREGSSQTTITSLQKGVKVSFKAEVIEQPADVEELGQEEEEEEEDKEVTLRSSPEAVESVRTEDLEEPIYSNIQKVDDKMVMQPPPPPPPLPGHSMEVEEIKVTSLEERQKHKAQPSTSKLSSQILKAVPPPRRKAISEARSRRRQKEKKEAEPAVNVVLDRPITVEHQSGTPPPPVPPRRNRSKQRDPPLPPPKRKTKK